MASKICNGDFYAGAALAPGDSIVWTADIRTEIKNYGKDLPAGLYTIRGRVKLGEFAIDTETTALELTRNSP